MDCISLYWIHILCVEKYVGVVVYKKTSPVHRMWSAVERYMVLYLALFFLPSSLSSLFLPLLFSLTHWFFQRNQAMVSQQQAWRSTLPSSSWWTSVLRWRWRCLCLWCRYNHGGSLHNTLRSNCSAGRALLYQGIHGVRRVFREVLGMCIQVGVNEGIWGY